MGNKIGIKLAGLYFLYFSVAGIFLPYWSVFLKEKSFSPEEISLILALIHGTKVVGPNIWGWIADSTGKRVGAIRLGALLALFFFGASMLGTGFWWLVAGIGFFGLFWNAILPQVETITLCALGERSHAYSRIRLWGSVGFIASCAGLAPVFQELGITLLPWFMVVLLGAFWVNALLLTETSKGRQGPPSQVHPFSILEQPLVPALLLACFFIQASHGPYYTFFTIYIEGVGYSRTVAGQLWALGVVAEVGAFLLVHRWLNRFGAYFLLQASMILAVVRWLMIALWAFSPVILISGQVLHAASFAVNHAAAIQIIYKLFPEQMQGRGQALYNSLCFGLGGAIGSLASGYVWSTLGGSWTFGLGAFLAFAGYLAVILGGLAGKPGGKGLNQEGYQHY